MGKAVRNDEEREYILTGDRRWGTKTTAEEDRQQRRRKRGGREERPRWRRRIDD